MGKPEKKVETPKRKYTKKLKPDSSTSVKILQEQVEQLTELLSNSQEQVEQLTELLSNSIEAQLEFYQISVEAEDKFNALAKETESSLNMMMYHCNQVQATTGSLTTEDVEYSVNLLKRIIEHKFKKA